MHQELLELARELMPINLKPSIEYASGLMRLAGVRHLVAELGRGECCFVVARAWEYGVNVDEFTNAVRGVMDRVNEGLKRLECFVTGECNEAPPQPVDKAKEARRLYRMGLTRAARELVDSIQCALAGGAVNEALGVLSRSYVIIKSIGQCGWGGVIIAEGGGGVFDLPSTKLGIARLLATAWPDRVAVSTEWGEYAELAWLVLRVGNKELPIIGRLIARAYGLNKPLGDRAIAYYTIGWLASRDYGVHTIIDFEGDVPIIIKFTKRSWLGEGNTQ